MKPPSRTAHIWALFLDGDLTRAIAALKKELKGDPTDYELHELMALCLTQRGEHVAAIGSIHRALALKPLDNASLLSNASYVYLQAADYPKALAHAESSLVLNPRNIHAQLNRGWAAVHLNSVVTAMDAVDRCRLTACDTPQIWDQIGTLALQAGAFEVAIKTLQGYLEHFPENKDALLNLSHALIGVGALESAQGILDSCRHDLKEHAQKARYFELAAISKAKGLRFSEAVQLFRYSLELAPNRPEPLINMAICLNEVQQYDDALSALGRAYALKPGTPFLLGRVIHQKLQCANWSRYFELKAMIDSKLSDGEPVAEPFGFQAISTDPQLSLLAAKQFNGWRVKNLLMHEGYVDHPKLRASRGQKVTLGFLGGEFRDHATLRLLIGLLENLDEKKYKLICFDNGVSDASELRKRLLSVAQVIPVSHLSDKEAFEEVRRCSPDILFDLNGFFGGERQSLLALRPCKIQVSYLGFPGTIGSDYLDIIIGDHIVTPESDHNFFCERVINLRRCYQPTDAKKRIPESVLGSKARSKFILACYNNTYKILPDIFEAWCEILRQIPNAELRLLKTSKTAASNMLNAAQSNGVNKEQLVFQSRTSYEEHLSRHTEVDLFLDTTPYNAHTTGSDSLWAGAPILTIKGTTFPGRVAESLLHAVGLDEEYVCPDRQTYVQRAIELASDPTELRKHQAHLRSNRLELSLFRSAEYAQEFSQVVERILDDSSARPDS